MFHKKRACIKLLVFYLIFLFDILFVYCTVTNDGEHVPIVWFCYCIIVWIRLTLVAIFLNHHQPNINLAMQDSQGESTRVNQSQPEGAEGKHEKSMEVKCSQLRPRGFKLIQKIFSFNGFDI
jgi:hypothetical protein